MDNNNLSKNRNRRVIGSSNTDQMLPNINSSNNIVNKINHNNSNSIDKFPKKFVSSMKTLFEIMDDRRTGFVNLADIIQLWQDDGSKGLPHGVVECLKRVAPPNGMLSFERFCTGLKICLLQNQVSNRNLVQLHNNYNDIKKNIDKRPQSAPLTEPKILPIHIQSQWLHHNLNHSNNNTATVRPNNSKLGQRTLSDHKLNVRKEVEISCHAPPKPPRTSLVMGNRTTNINYLDSFEKAEIRQALQNWQINVIRNGSSDTDSVKTISSTKPKVVSKDTSSMQQIRQQQKNPHDPQNKRRHTLQGGVDCNALRQLRHYEAKQEVLLEGLNAIESARKWYYDQLYAVQEKRKNLDHASYHGVSV